MKLDPGSYFFHYTNREAAFEHILPSGRLRLSPYTQVNDPLENKPWLIAAGYAVDESSDDAEQAQHVEHLKFLSGTSAVWDAAKLLALTVDAPPEAGYGGHAEPFGRGWARARMWDQYAEGHRGVCLLFDQDRLTKNLRGSLRKQGIPAPWRGAVVYTPEGPSELLSMALEGKVTPRGVADFIEQHQDALFFRKATDWATEFEYRFVVTGPADSEFVEVDYGDALEAVIVGERFPPWQWASAVESCQRAGVEAWRLDWSTRRPVPTELEPLGPEQFDLLAALRDAGQRALAERERD